MSNLRAVLFGIETLVDTSDVTRKAYNCVFEEAGLPWRWSAADYARLCRLSPGDDILNAFIQFERPFWRNSEDMRHLLAAVRRRHASLCSSSSATLADADTEMISIIDAVRSRGLRVCAVAPAVQSCPGLLGNLATAESYGGALIGLGLPADACIAVASAPEGIRAADQAGIARIDKLALSSRSAALDDAAIFAVLEDAHGSADVTERRPRQMAAALSA